MTKWFGPNRTIYEQIEEKYRRMTPVHTPRAGKSTRRQQTHPVLFITYTYDDPDEAPIEDVSGSLKDTRRWMRGRSGFVYRVERLADGSYGNEVFVEALNQ